MMLAPLTTLISASCESGTRPPSRVGTSRLPIAVMLVRASGMYRTVMSKRRSPSNRRAGGAAADRQLDHILDLADVDAVAGDLVAIDADPQLGLVGLLLDGGIGGARLSCG